jgi:RNA polymerase sigma-70 factor (ECF subfamily)
MAAVTLREEDAALLSRASRGDREAFEVLVRRHQGRVFWTAYQVIGHAEDARDVAQQVFLRVWTHRARYLARWRFTTWLHRITVNLAIDAWRRRQLRPAAELPEEQAVPEAGAGTDPDAALRRAEVGRIFLDLAARLSSRQRAVFVMREMNEMSTGTIAEILGVAESTVRNHLHQARQILRQGLAERYPEYLPGRSVSKDRQPS